jgi:hypothetical protein
MAISTGLTGTYWNCTPHQDSEKNILRMKSLILVISIDCIPHDTPLITFFVRSALKIESDLDSLDS